MSNTLINVVNNKRYRRITLEDNLAEKSPARIKNFIISERTVDTQNRILNLHHPYLIEGVTLALCTKGHGRMRINFQEYEFCENTLISIIPGYMVEMLYESEDLTFEFFFFTFDFIVDFNLIMNIDLSEKIEQMPCLKLNKKETQNLLEYHAFIVKQYKKTENTYRDKIVKSLLYGVICEIIQLYEDSYLFQTVRKKTRQEELTSQFFELLFKHYKQERKISFYADQMFITSKYLSKIIKESTGKPINQWIDEMVIMAVKALLKTSDMTNLQISEELNFANASFYSSFFRKRTGMTPIQYRESE